MLCNLFVSIRGGQHIVVFLSTHLARMQCHETVVLQCVFQVYLQDIRTLCCFPHSSLANLQYTEDAIGVRCAPLLCNTTLNVPLL